MNPFTFGGTTETRTRTVWLRARYATITSLFHSGGCGGNRTHNPRIKSPMLCQLSYTPFGESTEIRTRTVWLKARYATITSLILVNAVGIEPTTLGLKVRCSTNWATHTFWWVNRDSNSDSLVKSQIRCHYVIDPFWWVRWESNPQPSD